MASGIRILFLLAVLRSSCWREGSASVTSSRMSSQLSGRTLSSSQPPGSSSSDVPIVRTLSRSEFRRLISGADIVHLSGLSRRGSLAAIARHPIVVTHHGYQAALPVGTGLCRLRGTEPIPVCEHLWQGGRPTSACRLLLKGGFALARRAATVNVFPTANLAQTLGLPRSLVVSNSVGYEFDPPTDAVCPHVSFIGSLSIGKGFNDVCDAIDLIEREPDGCGIHWIIAGHGPLEYRATELRRRLGARFQHISQEHSGVPEFLRSSTVAVAPSRMAEPFCYAAAEPLAAGVPIVATAVGAIPEVLVACGVYVEWPPRRHELAAAIRRVIAWTPEPRSAWRSSANQLARRFCPGRAADAYLRLSRQVVVRSERAL
jgi:glycosyltransferase involved in cell wall biosynthesis